MGLGTTRAVALVGLSGHVVEVQAHLAGNAPESRRVWCGLVDGGNAEVPPARAACVRPKPHGVAYGQSFELGKLPRYEDLGQFLCPRHEGGHDQRARKR